MYLVVAAFRAEAVFAGVVAIAIGVAVLAEIDFTAEIVGAAVCYILYSALMAG